MEKLEFKDVVMYYKGAEKPAIDNVSLELNGGEVIVFIGPSGCGKTTLLKMVNRLFNPTSGCILLDGEDIKDKDPVILRRNIGYSIQQTGLFPHMTILENIGVVPKMLNWDEDKIKCRAEKLLKMVELDPKVYLNRYPNSLSGGQQQRVGIARALAADSDILIMDEPFSAIDPVVRKKLQDELLKIQKHEKKTIMFVTHDIEEALRLSDKIVILKDGKVIQCDTPMEILNNPKNDFVEKFIGCDDITRKLGIIKIKDVKNDLNKKNKNPNESKLNINESLKEAVEVFLENDCDSISVLDDDKNYLGDLEMSSIKKILKNKVKV